jgi:hypothetical protein
MMFKKNPAAPRYSKAPPFGKPKLSAPIQLPAPEDFYLAEIEGLSEYPSGWAWGHCPFHADRNPSFTVNMETGAFRCMSSSCGVHGGGLVSFVSQLHGLDYKAALRFLGDWS